jgi:hypothetical protein
MEQSRKITRCHAYKPLKQKTLMTKKKGGGARALLLLTLRERLNRAEKHSTGKSGFSA